MHSAQGVHCPVLKILELPHLQGSIGPMTDDDECSVKNRLHEHGPRAPQYNRQHTSPLIHTCQVLYNARVNDLSDWSLEADSIILSIVCLE